MVIQKLQEKLFILKGRTIGLLGLAFKPDTDDLRDAPSLHIAERLLQMGARVKAYDPDRDAACREQHPDLKIRYCDTAAELASGCRRPGAGHRMARVLRSRPGRPGAPDGQPDAGGWPQLLRARDCRGRRLRLFRHRPLHSRAAPASARIPLRQHRRRRYFTL